MNHLTQYQAQADRVIWRQDLVRIMCVSSETVRRWMASGKLPRPDVEISRRTRGWKLSTLRLAGIDLGFPVPASENHRGHA